MNTKSHTVTIPIEDYNELIKAQELVGLTKVSETSDIYLAIQRGATSLMSHNDQNPIANIEIYTRRIKI